jgi:hypothetical protein
MIAQLLDPKVQTYLQTHRWANPAQIALQKSPFAQVDARSLASQIDSRQRLSKKMPIWSETPGIIYPPRISIEQSSSAKTAEYKAQLFGQARKGMDMTGGMGIDSYAFSISTQEVLYAEQQAALAAISKHNFQVLGRENITVLSGDSMEHLKTLPNGHLDWIYLDPARRQEGRKVFLLDDCEPNILEWAPLLFEKAPRILIKLSPMLDLHQAYRALPNISSFHILSVDQECKEVLIEVKKTADKPIIVAKALSLPVAPLQFTWEEEQQAQPTYGAPKRYLYDPDVALTKAGAFKLTAVHYKLQKLHPHTHVYTSDHFEPGFMGQIFEIEEIWTFGDFKKSKIKGKASISTRQFPIRAEILKKTYKWEDDQLKRLFFVTGPDGTHLTVLGKWINPSF